MPAAFLPHCSEPLTSLIEFMPDTASLHDNRTGKSYELPIEHDTIKAMDLRQIKCSEDDFGMMSYDPAFKNTASTKSSITFIDGENGILRYRGYPIEDLANNSNFYESSYLVLYGELPLEEELKEWESQITYHTLLHENIKQLMDAFRYDAHPMGMFTSTVAALSTFYPRATEVHDAEVRRRQIVRLIAKVPTIAAFSYRHSRGLPYVYPDNGLSYASNFLNMMFRMPGKDREPHPALERALDTLFVLHLDHEQNCSTNAMRSIGSSLADPYLSLAGAAAALSGPLHGGANQRVLEMLTQIGDKSEIGKFIKDVKNGNQRLMGFGHRVYKNYDPRAKVIKTMVNDVFEVTGRNRLLDIAEELEKIALNDDYFVSRKLYPNVDFYSGIVYQAMGIPTAMFPVLFAIARTVGWLAQWEEMLEDDEQKIARPRQIYLGEEKRDYIKMNERS